MKLRKNTGKNIGIGRKIKELRLKQGITQEILARKIGVTPSAIGNYEREISFPKETVLMKLFGALECTPNELLGEPGAFSEREYAQLKKYAALDEHGKKQVDECTDRELRRIGSERKGSQNDIQNGSDEFEEVTIAARNGSGELITLKKRKGKSIFDLPDYGGRR